MRILVVAITFATVFLAVYQVIPYLLHFIDKRMRTTQSRMKKEINTGNNILPLTRFSSITKKSGEKLRQAGFVSELAQSRYLAFIILVIITGLIAGIWGLMPVTTSFLFSVLLICMVNSWIARRAKTRQAAFKKALYKIYHFLDMQITSGIKVTDAIKGISESVRDSKIRPAILRFVATYELTLDLDTSVDELRQDFPGPECDLLAAHIQQCLQTGQAGRSLRRMEELMFTRYFNLLQEDTRRLRTYLFWLALPALGSFIIIMLYPLLYTAAQAWTSVFG